MLFKTLDENGKRYCEWIVNVRDCEDEQFFMDLQVFSAAICFVSGILLIISAIIKGVGLKQGFMAYVKTNISFVVLIIEVFWFFVYSMMVITNANKLAIYIVWAALYPSTFLPAILFVDFLRKGLTQGVKNFFQVDSNLKTCILSDKTRKIVLLSLVLYGILIMVSLVTAAAALEIKDNLNVNLSNTSISGDYSDNVNDLSRKIMTAAMMIHGIDIWIVTFLFYSACSDMLTVLKRALTSNGDAKIKNEDKHIELFKITYSKIRQLLGQTIIYSTITSIYFFLLAFYDNFFVNIYCAKAFSVISIGFVPVLFFLMGLMYLITEIRRVRYSKESKPVSLEVSARTHSQGKVSSVNEDTSNSPAQNDNLN